MTAEVSQFPQEFETEARCGNCKRAQTFCWDGSDLLTCDQRGDLIRAELEDYGKSVEDCWVWDGKSVMARDALPERYHVMDEDESERACHNCAHCLHDYKAEIYFCESYGHIHPHDSLYTPIGAGDDCEEHEYESRAIPESYVVEGAA